MMRWFIIRWPDACKRGILRSYAAIGRCIPCGICASSALSALPLRLHKAPNRYCNWYWRRSSDARRSLRRSAPIAWWCAKACGRSEHPWRFDAWGECCRCQVAATFRNRLRWSRVEELPGEVYLADRLNQHHWVAWNVAASISALFDLELNRKMWLLLFLREPMNEGIVVSWSKITTQKMLKT